MNGLLDLSQQHVIVTGGTRGIGRAIALQLARAGALVTANHVRLEAQAQSLQQAARDENLAIDILRADMTTSKGQDALAESAHAHPSRTLSVVHAAATGVHRAVGELSTRHWDWTHGLNVRAFFELITRALPRLANQSAVVALSSAGAVRAVPHYAAIGSSKAALESLVRHLAVELAPRGARVNVVSPGSVLTDAWQAFPDKEKRLADAVANTPSGRLVTPEDVARLVHFLVSPASQGIVGQTLVIDGGARVVD
jgi:NAD(P)-dependent dehydrogenase (short-subunit alcohol dehydrogenase family)